MGVGAATCGMPDGRRMEDCAGAGGAATPWWRGSATGNGGWDGIGDDGLAGMPDGRQSPDGEWANGC
ncbi:hypothetical protein GUJ93_ZPchr0004g39039 [Zizania palustris]|uniref:Uncharacterized protein n=1 Tax=Zizania palustris TaxID=103762 RepID=A0A8J5VM85_ZIZPA|nr:hypothetical protein GUJ93_ZPchr0004g39039 [Zizania palustris]